MSAERGQVIYQIFLVLTKNCLILVSPGKLTKLL